MKPSPFAENRFVPAVTFPQNIFLQCSFRNIENIIFRIVLLLSFKYFFNHWRALSPISFSQNFKQVNWLVIVLFNVRFIRFLNSAFLQWTKLYSPAADIQLVGNYCVPGWPSWLRIISWMSSKLSSVRNDLSQPDPGLHSRLLISSTCFKKDSTVMTFQQNSGWSSTILLAPWWYFFLSYFTIIRSSYESTIVIEKLDSYEW